MNKRDARTRTAAPAKSAHTYRHAAQTNRVWMEHVPLRTSEIRTTTKAGNSLRLVSANSHETAGQTGTLCSTPALAYTGSTENETDVS